MDFYRFCKSNFGWRWFDCDVDDIEISFDMIAIVLFSASLCSFMIILFILRNDVKSSNTFNRVVTKHYYMADIHVPFKKIDASKIEFDSLNSLLVVNRDKGRCQYCGVKYIRRPTTKTTKMVFWIFGLDQWCMVFDAVLDPAIGGKVNVANVVCAHVGCEKIKGTTIWGPFVPVIIALAEKMQSGVKIHNGCIHV